MKKKEKEKTGKRIHGLAKELGIDTKELIEKLKALNFPVKSHMTVVDDETAEIIKHEIGEIKKKEVEENVIEVDFPITVKELAVKLNKKPSGVLGDLIREGKFININQSLSEEGAKELAYKYKVNLMRKPTREEQILKVERKDARARAPIVTLMGHIDHGKTTLLDYIRKSKIVEKETGGITQHIGAYQVGLTKNNQIKRITFLDTPGHETFTAMRARGANITDLVVLVVAADEGVKPQTTEAADHAKAANVPIIVAISKIDKPNADIDLVKQQLSKIGFAPSDWGGKTTTVGVSAKTGQGIDELLDLILLEADLMELKADYTRGALGVVVEARLSKGKGPLATVLVQEGVLKKGDFCVCGKFSARIRAMQDDLGNEVSQALPAFPVEILGLNGIPNPGDQLLVVPDEASAKDIIRRRKEEEEKKKLFVPSHMKLEDLYKKIKEEDLKQLKIILKADVGGTLQAIGDALGKIASKEVELNIVHKGVGAVSYSDVLLAEVSDAVIVGFKVSVDAKTRNLAKLKGIEIRLYQIIYELIDEIRAALEGLLSPQIKRTFVGRAKVKTVFKLSKSGIVAGCDVTKGKATRGVVCKLVRDSEVIFEGKIQSLKRFKDDVKEVNEGLECGISIGYDKIKEGDVIDLFSEEVIARKLK